MRRILLLILFVPMLIFPVSALEITAPEAPESAEEYMPENTESFAQGLWYVIKTAVQNLQPSIAEASGVCMSVMAAVLLCSLVQSFSGSTKHVVNLVSAITIGIMLFQPSNSMLQLGIRTIQDMTEYGNLLLPVMTSAMAAQGGTASSAALYSGTVLFNGILSTAISKLIVPMVYVYICFIIANSALGQEHLKELQKFVKWLMTWILKIILYVFTGYLGITGVISGSADAAAVKAAKLTISGFVPVVGSIISDASETILVSAGVVKSGVGVYGLLALISVLVGPFLQIGVQYLLIKLTGSVCSVFGVKQSSQLIKDFSGAMGIILAMTGTVGLLLMVSTVCFMKGIT